MFFSELNGCFRSSSVWETLRVFADRATRIARLLRLRPFDVETPEGRADERYRRVALTAGASMFAKLVTITTQLISVPLTLHYLGAERYGMWMVMISVIGMFSFADLGMGNGVLNAVAEANGRDDRAAIVRFVSSGILTLLIVAVTLMMTFASTYEFVDWHKIFNVTSDLAQQEAGPALATMVVCFALAIPLSVVQKLQLGLQQGFAASLWQCVSALAGLIAMLVAIRQQAGLPWLVLAAAGAPLLASLMNGIVFFGVSRPDLAPELKSVSRVAAARIARTGLLFFVLQMMFGLAYNSDSLVIAQILGASSVAQYSVPEKMFAVVSQFVVMGLSPLWPAYGEALARGDDIWARRTLERSLILAMGAAALLSIMLVALGSPILMLWVGHAVEVPFTLLLALGVWKVLEAAGSAFAVFLNGANVLKFQAVLLTLTAIAGVILKIVLAKNIGLPGIVIATMLSFTMFTLLPALVFIRRTIRQPAYI